ncbi:MAG: hypothetical protein ABJC07_12460 [Acidobacteriota bacterium]
MLPSATALLTPMPSLSTLRSRGCRLGILLVLFTATACRSDATLARRILDAHRRATGVRPLAGSQVIRLSLSSTGGAPAEAGTEQIEWDTHSYRETVSSAGATTVLGIQGGKAYFTDEDGVTRVVSEPILAQLTTRSYFWRRGYLFDDAERAGVALGPADATRVTLRLAPRQGDPLMLSFDRRTMQLAAVRSPGLVIDFQSPTRWRMETRRGAPVQVEHRHTGLPTHQIADAVAGGWSSHWGQPAVEAPLLGSRAAEITVEGSVGGQKGVFAIDSAADGPVRLRSALAARLALLIRTDVFGRRIARGGPVAIGGWSEPDVWFEVSEAIPSGADVSLGAALFREAAVEYDPDGRKVRLLDTENWVRPEGYYRAVLDDDGDRPVAILKKGRELLRVLAGAATPTALTVARASARRLGYPADLRSAEGLHWGPAPLPPLDLAYEDARFDPAAGDDGRLSARFLLRFHAIIDMPHRWAYLKPEAGAANP